MLYTQINTNEKSHESTNKYEANAFAIDKEVFVKVFEEDRKTIPKEDLDLGNFSIVNDIGPMISDINTVIEPIGIEIPFDIYSETNVEEFWAEVINDPKVVLDRKGTVTLFVSANIASLPIVPAGFGEITLGISGQGGPIFLYDTNKRNKGEPIMPPDQSTGGTVGFTLSLSLSAGVSLGGWTLVGITGTGESSLNLIFGSDESCLFYFQVVVSEIAIYGTFNNPVEDVSSDKIVIFDETEFDRVCLTD